MKELFAAIDAGDAEGVRTLVAQDGERAAARNPEGLSAVLAATYRHRADMVELLLAAQPLLDIFEASAVGDVERIEALLDHDPALAEAYAPDGHFPLGLAAFFGRADAARLLLERGADVHAAARNSMRVQALHAAVAGRHEEIVRLLLDAGADPNVRQQEGWTPLMAAAAHGDEGTVDLLLAAGADRALANDAGATAASLAADHGHAALAERLQGVT